jgi:hypothetical protein
MPHNRHHPADDGLCHIASRAPHDPTDATHAITLPWIAEKSFPYPQELFPQRHACDFPACACRASSRRSDRIGKPLQIPLGGNLPADSVHRGNDGGDEQDIEETPRRTERRDSASYSLALRSQLPSFHPFERVLIENGFRRFTELSRREHAYSNLPYGPPIPPRISAPRRCNSLLATESRAPCWP